MSIDSARAKVDTEFRAYYWRAAHLSSLQHERCADAIDALVLEVQAAPRICPSCAAREQLPQERAKS